MRCTIQQSKCGIGLRDRFLGHVSVKSVDAIYRIGVVFVNDLVSDPHGLLHFFRSLESIAVVGDYWNHRDHTGHHQDSYGGRALSQARDQIQLDASSSMLS